MHLNGIDAWILYIIYVKIIIIDGTREYQGWLIDWIKWLIRQRERERERTKTTPHITIMHDYDDDGGCMCV